MEFGGKRYHGIRYPQDGTVRPPLCIVTVYPGENEPYELRPRLDLKNYTGVKGSERSQPERFSFEWGRTSDTCFILPEWQGDDREYHPYPVHKAGAYKVEQKDRAKQLALAIMADFTGDDIMAVNRHLQFYESVITTLPELEWIIDDAFMVLKALSTIKG